MTKQRTIDDNRKVEYFQELIIPYEKKGKKKFFIDQYINGAGKELRDHFWSKKSSSRLAYEMFSWMKDDPRIKDIEFEYHLKGLASGGEGPNIDVFIETEEEILFIESKFTEKAKLEYKDTGYLSKGYYDQQPYGSKQMTLTQRFYGFGFSEHFSTFCDRIDELCNKYKDKNSQWFEPKQETCHLFGVLIYIFKVKPTKKVRLINIYWNLKEDNDMLANDFKEKANDLIQNVGYGKRLTFEHFTIQDILEQRESLSPKINFPETTKTKIYKIVEEAEENNLLVRQ